MFVQVSLIALICAAQLQASQAPSLVFVDSQGKVLPNQTDDGTPHMMMFQIDGELQYSIDGTPNPNYRKKMDEYRMSSLSDESKALLEVQKNLSKNPQVFFTTVTQELTDILKKEHSNLNDEESKSLAQIGMLNMLSNFSNTNYTPSSSNPKLQEIIDEANKDSE